MSTIVSNAYNFSEHISSGVDTRTGSYAFSINLGQFLSHNTSGLAISLMLSYNAASSFDMGFGSGWGLALSRFDKSSNTLSLSTGQSFTIAWNSDINEYEMPYRKLKDIRVFYLDATKELKVVYKDGRKEFIDYEEGTLSKLVSPSGLVTDFEYSRLNQTLVLWRIIDNAGRELTIDWWSDKYKTTVEHRVHDQLYQSMIFDKNGGRLTNISFSGQSTSTTIQYRFVQSSGYDLIEKVTHDSGLIEEITYKDLGHTLPNGAPLSKVPYISSYRMIAGENQPDQYITYQYSDKNYLGFASDQAWKPGEDTLFKANREYQYSCTETINGSQSVYRVYNKYHLMDLAEYRQNGELYKSERNTYFADLDQGIERQPANYSFVKQQQAIYYHAGSSKTFTLSYDYDQYGNQIYSQQADGSEIRREFYPAAGDGDNCPPEPNGMVSLLKRESFIPASTHTGETPRHADMTYLKLSKLDGSGEYFVLLKGQKFHDHSVSMSYYSDQKKPYEYGRLHVQATVVNGKTTKTTWQYHFRQDGIETVQEFLTHDGLKGNVSAVARYIDGQIVQQTSTEGVKTVSEYDALGRTIKQTVAPGTDYVASVSYQYAMGSNNNAITTTDSKGNMGRQRLNNAGQVVEILQTDVQGIERVISQNTYNAFGLLIAQTESDWSGNEKRSLTTEYAYDAMGQINKVIHPDGREELIQQNPTTLTSTYQMVGLLKEVTTYDYAGLELSKETYDASGQLLAKTHYRYDGYANLISTTDTNNRVTTQRYDSSDRVVAIERTIDGKVVTQGFEYADFTTEALSTRVAVNNIELGQQQYDGLTRLKQVQSAAGTTAFSYAGLSVMPATKTTAEGDTLEFKNNVYLQVPISVGVAGQRPANSTYTYDATTGQLLGNLNQNTQHAIAYNRLGQLESEAVQFSDGVMRTATYKSSLAGRPLSKTDFFGNTTTYAYDNFGRLQSVTSATPTYTSTTVLSYDSHSRPIRFDTSNGQERVSVQLTLNTLGLETQRKVTINDQEAFTLSQTFNSDLQISQKIYTEGNEITTEEMTYDDLHRLVLYTCAGPNAPQDEYGNHITAQRFGYDLYGNVIRAESNFLDGTSNIATFTYANDNPVQLVNMRNTHPDYVATIDFKYDRAGNLLVDDKNRHYEYNALGEMVSVSAGGQQLSGYQYNALGQVVSQTHDDAIIYLYYQGEQLVNEYSDGVYSSYQGVSGAADSRTLQGAGQSQHQFLLANGQGSVISTLTSTPTAKPEYTKRQYTPYGEGKSA